MEANSVFSSQAKQSWRTQEDYCVYSSLPPALFFLFFFFLKLQLILLILKMEESQFPEEPMPPIVPILCGPSRYVHVGPFTFYTG